MLELKVLASIPEDPEIRRGTSLGQPIVVRKPDSPAAQAIKKLAADLIGEEYIVPTPHQESFVKKFMGGIFGKKA